MKRRMSQGIAATILALCLLGASAQEAQATDGYVCWLSYRAKHGWIDFGNYGYVTVTLYSQPACAGSYVSYGYLSSTGGDTTSTYVSDYQYGPTALAAVYESLQEAGIQGHLVSWDSCPGKTAACYRYVSIYSKP
jgi:hypothetical protein